MTEEQLAKTRWLNRAFHAEKLAKAVRSSILMITNVHFLSGQLKRMKKG